MQRTGFVIILSLWFILLGTAQAAQAKPSILYYTVNDTQPQTQFTIELSEDVEYKTFTLTNHDRLVIDLKHASWKVPENTPRHFKGPRVEHVRYGWPKKGVTRIVLDLKEKVHIQDTYMVVPQAEGEPHRLIVILYPPEAAINPPTEAEKLPPAVAEFVKQESAPEPPENITPQQKPAFLRYEQKALPAPKERPKPAPVTPEGVHIPPPFAKPFRPLIVLDPGHGGADPGAISPNKGLLEKEITLDYALTLKRMLEDTGRYTVRLTRTADYYLALRDRVQAARDMQGDLFISLHADSFPQPEIRGLSVYTLSEEASDEEAEELAKHENKENVINGIDLSDDDEQVAEVLIDMVQRDTQNASAYFAEILVEELGDKAKLLKNTHRFAGFVVLTGADVPSVLVELGYLSNPEEEALLVKPEYRAKLTESMRDAINQYFTVRKAF